MMRPLFPGVADDECAVHGMRSRQWRCAPQLLSGLRPAAGPAAHRLELPGRAGAARCFQAGPRVAVIAGQPAAASRQVDTRLHRGPPRAPCQTTDVAAGLRCGGGAGRSFYRRRRPYRLGEAGGWGSCGQSGPGCDRGARVDEGSAGMGQPQLRGHDPADAAAGSAGPAAGLPSCWRPQLFRMAGGRHLPYRAELPVLDGGAGAAALGARRSGLGGSCARLPSSCSRWSSSSPAIRGGRPCCVASSAWGMFSVAQSFITGLVMVASGALR